jgi:hypothetical protein
MLELEIIQGSARDWPLEAVNQGGTTPSGFLESDGIKATLWSGQDQAQLFEPAVSWRDASTGQFDLAVSNAQSATLQENGDYHIQVNVSRAGKLVTIADLLLRVFPSPGAATQLVVPYCTYHDLLNRGDWISRVQANDFDQQGFYTQRLQARQWMDQAILNNWRGAGMGLYGAHSESAFAFGGGYGPQRSIGPSQTLIGYLAANYLMLKPYIVEACSHWALSLKGLSQVGTNNQNAAYGAYHRDMAERRLTGITAEIDINGDGIGELFINLGSTDTLFT